MRINDNGKIREMTVEELRVIENINTDMPKLAPSNEMRIEALEKENKKLRQDNENLWIALAEVKAGDGHK